MRRDLSLTYIRSMRAFLLVVLQWWSRPQFHVCTGPALFLPKICTISGLAVTRNLLHSLLQILMLGSGEKQDEASRDPNQSWQGHETILGVGCRTSVCLACPTDPHLPLQNPEANPRPTAQDLAGFWDLLQLSIEDISMKFDELYHLKANSWQLVETPEKRKVSMEQCGGEVQGQIPGRQ